MSKIYMVSTAFAPARVVTESMKQLYRTAGTSEFEHHILMQHYPLSKDLNDKLLTTIFNYYNCKIHDLGSNVGLSAGYNYLINQLNLQDDDIVIGADLDTYPITDGWMDAIVKVMKADSNIAYCSLQNQHSEKELNDRGYSIHTVANTVCYEGHTPVVQSIIGWSPKVLKQFNGIQEQRKMYGGSEVTMWPKLQAAGYKWYYLPQYKEVFHPLCQGDRCYIVWKWSYAHLRDTDLDFESWINEKPEREFLE